MCTYDITSDDGGGIEGNGDYIQPLKTARGSDLDQMISPGTRRHGRKRPSSAVD